MNNQDVISNILAFCGKAYIYVATVNRTWRHAYGTANTETSICQTITSVSRARTALPILTQQQSFNSKAFFHACKLA